MTETVPSVIPRREPIDYSSTNNESQPLLTIRDLRVHFYTLRGTVYALEGVNLDVQKEETMGIVGETGCGKSITARAVLRLIDPPGKIVSGTVEFDGQELLNLHPKEMRRIRGKRISMIMQEPRMSLNPVIRVGNQVAETLLIHESDLSPSAARKKAEEMLQSVGIPDAGKMSKRYPHELSGGMAQRVMIAMMLVTRPKLLIADEPTSALDVTIQAQIIDLMNDLVHELQSSVMMISHDLGVVAETCDRVAVMYAGSVVEQGRVEDVLHNPRHPYTKGLLRTLPDNASENEDLYSIKGNVPSLFMPQQQCRFAPRCEFSQERCFQEIPGSYQVGNNHSAACFLHENGI